MQLIGNDWDKVLEKVFESSAFKELYSNIQKEYDKHTCYPDFNNIFNALKLTPYKDVKMVIIGQDPYHGQGQAHGLSFSVQEGAKIPPSLQNIFKEYNSDLGYDIPSSGELTKWAKEGVLLLNSILSVEKDKPLSHEKYGWQYFTNVIIRALNNKKNPIVFVLWGNHAQCKKEFVDDKKHLILQCAHPSPFSARLSFFGSKPFSKTNDFLIKTNQKVINFKL